MTSDIIIWKGNKVTNSWIRTNSYSNLNPITQVSGICINNKNEILLLKESGKDYWMLPGGTPEKGEKYEQTLIRELKEEASCDIEKPSLIGAIKVHYPNNPKEKEGENFYQLRFFAKINKINMLKIDPDRGTKHMRIFVPLKKITDYVTWKNVGKEILKEVEEIIS